MMTQMCGDDDMATLMATIAADDSDEIAQVDRMLMRYPDDPRLHFLRGSILAGIGRPIEALAALKTAVALAPDFAIARFQLGFFQLTSGEAGDALGTWGPLALLPDGDYLRLFVTGLTHLIRDEFAQAIAALEAGIGVNEENLPLNRDMQLIIDKVGAIPAPGDGETEDTMSATSLLLGQFGGSGRPN